MYWKFLNIRTAIFPIYGLLQWALYTNHLKVIGARILPNTSILFPDVLSSDVCNQQMVSCPHLYLNFNLFNFLQRNPISKIMKATIICKTL